MNVFFFGSSEHRLLGCHHEPPGAARGQILICQPWGPEYEFAHRTCRVLAVRLARQGWHVLRFDYRGTGDSWGETQTADLSNWTHDVDEAVTELRAITGLETVGAIGLRIGATLLTTCLGNLGQMGRLVLWDPITNGSAWVRALDAVRPPGRRGALRDHLAEVGGQVVTKSFRDSLVSIRPASWSVPKDSTLVLHTALAEESAPLTIRDNPTFVTLDEPSPWLEDVALGSGRIPTGAIAQICEWFKP